MQRRLFILPAFLFLTACGNSASHDEGGKAGSSETPIVEARDKHTQSNADSVEPRHLDLDIAVDFAQKKIRGNAAWNVNNKTSASALVLDTYDLRIDSITVDGASTQFSLGDTVEHLGQALRIPVGAGEHRVKIFYESSPGARALQWLTPQQTDAKTQPFLYTQSESIYARSWIPCPDGPGIRFTYSARVQVPKGLIALMSAENSQTVSDSGVYHFKMDKPIPAYLMALAVGDLRFKSIDERTGVYAEPTMIDKARYEFEDVGRMVATAEKMYGPYRWGRYDVLVLPPGFPIGGMENPKLTFATPTILAGDRSLVNLIAHELAHNWSGNLVTNRTWNDFWLNEGFTVYFERRLTEAMQGADYTDMLWVLGRQDLDATLEELGNDSKDTHLKLDLTGRDPDEGLTDIAYEKGALLLRRIEETVGRERFDPFLKGYFDAHAFETISTESFLRYLDKNLLKGDSALYKKIDLKAWVYGPGLPANVPTFQPARFKAVDAERQKFLAGTAPQSLATKAWTTHEWLHFLRGMPKPLAMEKMRVLDDAFHFTASGNSEVADLWFVMAVAAKYDPAYPAMDKFLSRVGRRKFLTPLYGEMMKSGQEALAKRIYSAHRAAYHPIAQGTLDELVLGKKGVDL
jgi:leukotriene A-4 hydrolase/aminopeptidase